MIGFDALGMLAPAFLPDAFVAPERIATLRLASAGFVVLMTLLLGIGETIGGKAASPGFTFLENLFTCMSAFGTVGLDVGVTANLSRLGQLVLMVCMFVGRLGILLVLSALYGSRPPSRVGYPREEVYL